MTPRGQFSMARDTEAMSSPAPGSEKHEKAVSVGAHLDISEPQRALLGREWLVLLA